MTRHSKRRRHLKEQSELIILKRKKTHDTNAMISAMTRNVGEKDCVFVIDERFEDQEVDVYNDWRELSGNDEQ